MRRTTTTSRNKAKPATHNAGTAWGRILAMGALAAGALNGCAPGADGVVPAGPVDTTTSTTVIADREPAPTTAATAAPSTAASTTAASTTAAPVQATAAVTTAAPATDDPAPGGVAQVVVDLSEQHIYLYDPAGALIARVPVSTGAPGSDTPTGAFVVQSKSETTYEAANPAVKMDWMVRFKGGIGFHSIPYTVSGDQRIPLDTPLGERPVSHGCVRTPAPWDRYLFDHVRVGTPVLVQT